MAYYVISGKNKKDFKTIDITKSPIFYKQSRYCIEGGCSLKEIDDFTMQFNNEIELKSHLLNNNILSAEDYNKSLSARIKDQDGYRKVMYDFLYQDSIEFMNNPLLVIKYLKDKLYENNFLFLKKYAYFFMEFYDCKSTAPELLSMSETSLLLGQRSIHFDTVDKNYDDIVTRVTKLLIYDYYQSPSGYINYSNKIKYKNFHTIVAFINNYERALREKEAIIDNNFKKRTLKKDRNIEGQTSLF